MKSRIRAGKVLGAIYFSRRRRKRSRRSGQTRECRRQLAIDVAGDTGNAKQSMTLTQEGGKITGTFKGPRQSGTIVGTVDGNKIKFHVTAGIPLDYTGTVDGDSMSGTMSGRGKTGDWKATRAK